MKKPFFKTLVLVLAIAGVLFLISMQNSDATFENGPVLIQLFTSQGCSSCPPADRLLKDIAEKYADKNVHVLSYHVDYWDQLGWKDTFSKKTFSEKQYAYAKTLNLNTVYTPQAIINGAAEFVGSNRTMMENAIKEFKNIPEETKISLDAKQMNNSISVKYKTNKMEKDDLLTFTLFIPLKNTAVARGENSGKSLLSRNIVLNEQKTAQMQGKMIFEIPDTFKNEHFGIMAYIQNSDKNIRAVSEKTNFKKAL